MAKLEVGTDFYYYSIEQELPALEGELCSPLYRAACHDSFEEVVIAPLDDVSDSAEQRRIVYDRALRLAHIEHSAVAPLFDSTTPDRKNSYIAWGIEPGRSLRGQIEKGPLDVQEAARTARNVGEGLAAIHEAGEIHGGLSPACIWVVPGGRTQLIGVGTATLDGRASAMTSSSSYRSPERLDGQDIDQSTDTWSLGVLLFEMLVGNVPFVSDDLEPLLLEMSQGPPASVLVPGTLPEQLRPLVARCLSPETGERPTIREATTELDDYLRELEPQRVARQPAKAESGVEIITRQATPAPKEPAPAIDDWSSTARWLKAEREKRAAEPEPRGLWIGPGLVLAVLLALALWWILW